MRETGFGQELSDLWAFALALCDLLGDDPPAMLDSHVVLEEARTAKDRAQLSPAAERILTAMEQFIDDCRGWWGVAHPASLLARVDGVQQRLAVTELTATSADEAGYWRAVLEAHVHTAHPSLPGILAQAEAYLAREA